MLGPGLHRPRPWVRLRDIATTLGIERGARWHRHGLTEAGYVIKDRGRPSKSLEWAGPVLTVLRSR
jgi:hypothetical protein